MSKAYTGSDIDPDAGREIRCGESVRVNDDGREGVVVDSIESGDIILYAVKFSGGDWDYFRPDEVTPTSNP